MTDLVHRLRTSCSPESPLGKLCSEAADALDWRDISSAPIDGTRILAAEPEGDGWVMGIATYCKTPHVPIYGFHFTEGDPEDWDIAHPTHWMPIPSHPLLPSNEVTE